MEAVDEDAPRLRLAWRLSLKPTEHLTSKERYIDTSDAALAEAGYAGRLRTSEAGTIITLKGLKRTDGGGAAHRREELEGAADASLPPHGMGVQRGTRPGGGDCR